MSSQSVRNKCIQWSPLYILVLVIGSSLSVCLVPSPTSSKQICFDDNNTDPNIINHRVDPIDEEEDDDNVFQPSHINETFLSSESRNKINSISSHSGMQATLDPKSSRKQVKESQYYVRAPNTQHKNRQDGSMFIPVAAYSITKRKPKRKKPNHNSMVRQKMSASTISVRQKRPNAVYSQDNDDNGDEPEEDEENEDDYEMRKESAVYGYIHKPEVIEFRGQYYYGQNEQDQGNKYNSKPPVEYDSHESIAPIVHERHRVSYIPMDTHYDEPSTTSILLNKLKKGITAKGLLLASLPLMLTPVLSYFLTPVVIPITATVAAGRRKRHANESDWMANGTSHRHSFEPTSHIGDIPEKKLNEAKILLQYLSKVKPDERLATSAVASFLECDGLFLPSDRCLEQLSCEFSDMQNANAIQLERAVTSIILAHLLHNEFISRKFKKRLKRAAVYGRAHSGQCKAKYPCQRVLLNQAHGRRRMTRPNS